MKSNNKQVFIVGSFDPYVAAIFRDKDWRGCKDITVADLVVFTGGEDINPELYHEAPIEGIRFNKKRDDYEKSMFNQARNYGIPMVGICRGAQLLNVLCGGRLWQHVDNHTSSHYLTDVITNEVTLVTSTHHQQMRPAQTAVLVARAGGNLSSPASLCNVKMADGIKLTHDVRVVFTDPAQHDVALERPDGRTDKTVSALFVSRRHVVTPTLG